MQRRELLLSGTAAGIAAVSGRLGCVGLTMNSQKRRSPGSET
jgi:hypothetical protein